MSNVAYLRTITSHAPTGNRKEPSWLRTVRHLDVVEGALRATPKSCGERIVGPSAASPGVLFGYARVSTDKRSLEIQADALRGAGGENTDKTSGAMTSTLGLSERLAYARRGDTLVVWKLDRFGRITKGLVDFVESLGARELPRNGCDGGDNAGDLIRGTNPRRFGRSHGHVGSSAVGSQSLTLRS